MNQVMDKLLKSVAPSDHPNMHLIDIENLIGAGKFNQLDVQKVRDLYRLATGLNHRDFVVIAAGPQNKRAIYEGWKNATYVWRRGHDGAELALIDLFERLIDISIYERVFIGSGDGKLATIADTSVVRDKRTTIVVGKGQKSSSLAVHECVYLTASQVLESSSEGGHA